MGAHALIGTGAPLGERFSRYVEPEPNTGCHLWAGAVNAHGYGRLTVGKTQLLAHRIAWVLRFGDIPDGLGVLHRCDLPACVNPDHLFLGSQLDNARDMAKKRRGRKGSLPYGVYRAGARFSVKVGRRFAGSAATVGEAAQIAQKARQERLEGWR